VTIHTDCDLDGYAQAFDPDLRPAPEDAQALLPFFTRNGMRRFSAEMKAQTVSEEAARQVSLLDDAPPAETSAPGTYETVLDWGRFDAWLARIDAAGLTAIDTETDSLDPMRARLVGISLSVRPARPPICRWPTPTPARPSSCRWPRCSNVCGPGWKTLTNPSSGRTPSTTAMCSPTRA
jgi:DNA polymerase I - 3''-5'' exonuclease and polymerase domains